MLPLQSNVTTKPK